MLWISLEYEMFLTPTILLIQMVNIIHTIHPYASKEHNFNRLEMIMILEFFLSDSGTSTTGYLPPCCWTQSLWTLVPATLKFLIS